ncbi:MAG: alpha/beta fold hydrolase [Bryobacteraceae bacterium]|jgi:alpha-beta hydrolase superfamily lysophospholipase
MPEETPEKPAQSPSSHRHSHSKTRLSPTLAADLRRVKRLLPWLLVLVPILTVFAAAFFASGLAVGPQERWQRPLLPASRAGLSPQKVSFYTRDGIRIAAWFERPWIVAKPLGTVILVHGAQGNKTGMASYGGLLLQRGFSVLLPDLRAHGESSGNYSSFGYREAADVLAAIAWVKQHSGGEPIVLFGYSAGAVAVLYAAAQSPDVTAVIVDSPHLDISDVLSRESDFVGAAPRHAGVPASYRFQLWLFTRPWMSGLARWVYGIRAGVPFESPEADLLAAVGKIRRPAVLFLAAERDPVVPAEHTRRLFNATASSNKQLVLQPGAYHSAMAGNPRRYLVTLTGFLEQTVQAVPAAAR